MKKNINYSLYIVLAILVAFIVTGEVRAQILSDPISFRIPLTICNAGSANCKTIYFGQHKDATYCRDTLYLFDGTKIVEEEQPPKPPSSVFDVRFIDNRTGTGKCLGEGIVLDLRPWPCMPTLDTFRVSLQSGDPDFPMTLTWPKSLSSYCFSCSMREIGGSASVVDMLTDTTVTLEDNTATGVRIYAHYLWCDLEVNEKNIPSEFSLGQNYPNPFNPTTVINYQLPITSYVTIRVFDVLGREVAILVNEKKEAGKYEVEWNADSSPSGVYFYKLVAGNYIETRKMLLIR
jgi:hypothetical protein